MNRAPRSGSSPRSKSSPRFDSSLSTLALVAICLLLAGAVPTVAVGSAPPEPLCSVCDDGFEDAAAEHGLNVTVTNSTAEVRVAADGTGHWTVENRVGNATADRLRSNPDLLYAVVTSTLSDHDRPRADRVSNLTARVVGDTVEVTFTYSSFADRERGSIVVVDYLHSGTERGSYGLDADRFTVVAPDGHRVVNDPATGRAHDNRVVWVNDATENEHGYDTYLPDTYVAFAQNDGLLARAATHVAFAARATPTVLTNLGLLAPAVLVFVGGFVALSRLATRSHVSADERSADERSAEARSDSTGVLDRIRSARGLAKVSLVFGVLAVTHPFYREFTTIVGGTTLAVVAVGVVTSVAGGVTLWRTARSRRERAVPWWMLYAPALAVLALTATAVALPGYPTTIANVSGSVAWSLPLAALFPLGYALARGDRRSTVAAFAVLLGVAALVGSYSMGFTEPQWMPMLLVLLSTVLAIFGVLVGVPLYTLGALLARETDVAGRDVPE